jgi:hypothetical protein
MAASRPGIFAASFSLGHASVPSDSGQVRGILPGRCREDVDRALLAL